MPTVMMSTGNGYAIIWISATNTGMDLDELHIGLFTEKWQDKGQSSSQFEEVLRAVRLYYRMAEGTEDAHTCWR